MLCFQLCVIYVHTSLNARHQVSHPYKTTGGTVFLFSFITSKPIAPWRKLTAPIRKTKTKAKQFIHLSDYGLVI
jgi:hypothetical protein